MAKYVWKPAAHISIAPQRAGERIEQVRRQKGGTVTPEDVVEDARNTRSPLHLAFQWNGRKAAEAFRRQQAVHLLNCLMIVVTVKKNGDEVAKPYRAYAVVTEGQNGSGDEVYVFTTEALANPKYRQQILERALRELEIWRQRYHDLAELAEIIAAVEQVTNKVRG